MKKLTIILAAIAFLSVPFLASASGTNQKADKRNNISETTSNSRNPLDVAIDLPEEPPITSVKATENQQYSLFPNPATNGNFRISATTDFEYTIINSQGKEISKGNSSQQNAMVQLPDNSPRAIYTVLLKNSNGGITLKKIVKA
jgi:hypothetical protein